MINFISLFLFDHLSFIRSFALQICKYIREEWVASHNWPNTFFRKIWARHNDMKYWKYIFSSGII